jgi:hypothetical protein
MNDDDRQSLLLIANTVARLGEQQMKLVEVIDKLVADKSEGVRGYNDHNAAIRSIIEAHTKLLHFTEGSANQYAEILRAQSRRIGELEAEVFGGKPGSGLAPAPALN